MAINASYSPLDANFLDASGNSKAPGTSTISISAFAAPDFSSASMPPLNKRSVIKLLKRLTTIAKRKPLASSFGCVVVSDWRFLAIFCKKYSLLSFELPRPLFQECFRSFAHVFRSARQAKKRGLQEQSFFLSHFHPALDS